MSLYSENVLFLDKAVAGLMSTMGAKADTNKNCKLIEICNAGSLIKIGSLP